MQILCTVLTQNTEQAKYIAPHGMAAHKKTIAFRRLKKINKKSRDYFNAVQNTQPVFQTDLVAEKSIHGHLSTAKQFRTVKYSSHFAVHLKSTLHTVKTLVQLFANKICSLYPVTGKFHLIKMRLNALVSLGTFKRNYDLLVISIILYSLSHFNEV